MAVSDRGIPMPESLHAQLKSLIAISRYPIMVQVCLWKTSGRLSIDFR
jgi:hypothetical protein